MNSNLVLTSGPNTILMALETLKYAIEFTSTNQKRQYVNRKHIINIANELRSVLKTSRYIS